MEGRAFCLFVYISVMDPEGADGMGVEALERRRGPLERV